jgi:asparagine synthase (glutamine-hydrolysing)
MSIIFGVRQGRDNTVHEQTLLDLAHATDRWAPDGTFVRAKGRIGMGVQPYRTHKRCGLEMQPVVDDLGNMVALDGRIDNYKELCERLILQDPNTPDSEIVLAAFMRWGEECFSRFIGDWALVLWSEREQSLYLSRDHAGTRSLYYEIRGERVLWATYLETLVASSEDLSFDVRYAARYISCLPVGTVTPYRSITAVPHAQYIKICEHASVYHCHWESTSERKIRYRSDAEYEDHFQFLFRQAVDRRLDGGALVLAELSGGLDSTSIVCMADYIRRDSNSAKHDLLDTVSYFNDSERSWNERPYVQITETARRKTGYHVNLPECLSSFQMSELPYLLPGASKTTVDSEQSLATTIGTGRYRAVLSGIGGDEVLGGIPSIAVELATDLLDGHYKAFVSCAVSWSLARRVPLILHLRDAVKCVIASDIGPADGPCSDQVPWLRIRLRDERHAENVMWRFRDWPSSFGVRRANNSAALSSVIESMPHTKHPYLFRREYRYPYLDRDLLTFLFNIPHEQIAIPGRRRYLMRRALKGLVPAEILERRRKAFLLRSPLVSIRGAHQHIQRLFDSSRLVASDLVDSDSFSTAVSAVTKGINLRWWAPVVRTIELELWLQAMESNRAPKTFSVDLAASA